ncbi:hypothetical protein B7463_g2144, partial [Scytalidium lignicola]
MSSPAESCVAPLEGVNCPTPSAQDASESDGYTSPGCRPPSVKWTRTGLSLKPGSPPKHVIRHAERKSIEDSNIVIDSTHCTDYNEEPCLQNDYFKSIGSEFLPGSWHNISEGLPLSRTTPTGSGLLLDQFSRLGVPYASSRSLYFFQYYLERLCPVLVMLDAPTNPLRLLLPPVALSSSMLLHAVCAVSACHMSQPTTSTIKQINLDAMHYYTRALHELNNSLSNCDDSRGGLSDEIILTTVFLCKYEIVKGSRKLWKQHIVGLNRLLNIHQSCVRKESNVFAFVKSFNIAKVTDLTDHLMDNTVVLKAAGACFLEDKSMGDLDPYMGFTESLLQTFVTISAISRQSRIDNPRTELQQQDIENLKDKLATWTCSSKSYTVPSGVSPKHLQNLELVAEAYRFAAYIYLHSIQRQVSLEELSHSQNKEFDLNLSYSNIPSTTEDAITRCLDVIDKIPCGDGCESSLVLPLFLAGCETNNPAQITTVIRKFMKMEQTIGLGNIRRAREVVQKVWYSAAEVTGKRHWQLVVQELGWDLILT